MFKPQFPDVIDNSLRKTLVKCETAARYQYIQGVRATGGSRVDLVAGAAFAKGMETMRRAYYEEADDPQVCLEKGLRALYEGYGSFVPPVKTNKTVERMAGALAFYAQECPLEDEKLIPLQLPDGKRAVEVSFNYELPIMHPDTEKPLSYAGRFDMLALDPYDVAWVVDEKTTSQMGEKWANQWPLDSQMTGYCWGATQFLRANGFENEVGGAIINGIAIRLRDYEHSRFNAYRQPWELERWYEQMLRDIERLKHAYLNDDYNMALDHACAYYNNPCEYMPLCQSRNPERLMLGGGWQEVRWNPLTRSES